jgi:hypothetical protein
MESYCLESILLDIFMNFGLFAPCKSFSKPTHGGTVLFSTKLFTKNEEVSNNGIKYTNNE